MSAVIAVLLSCSAAYASGDDSDARQQAAESQFDSVMIQNAYQAPGNGEEGDRKNRMKTRREAPSALPTGRVDVPTSSEVEVPLGRYESVRASIQASHEEALRSYATLVVLGASSYTGRAVQGGLALHVELRATLRGPGLWKTVPLVGDEVAVVSARTGAVPLPLTSQNGYQVWVTDQVGEVTLDLDLLVPARGPRGSIEYDFLVPRTPVTRFDCVFPAEGLEPRLQRAVRAGVTSGGGSTRLSAWLEPTSRIRLVGFRDLGEDQERAARIYAESLHLLSVDESTADLFTVIRYNILQAGNRQFDVLVPPGLTVVSADGEGAFRYTLGEPTAEGTVLHGETAFPIRDDYEISLRLSRSLEGGSGAAFDVLPPRAMGVEREYGWLAVEVIGNLNLEEVERDEALAVDVSQLPIEMAQSAVSPILKGYRFHSSGTRIRLTATSLPEREPAAGSIDRIKATTVVATEGRAFTDLQITLRNRLRHSLRLRLPEGVEVRSSLLDGDPVKPSKDKDGALLFPLKRSGGGDRPEPFTLQLVLEGTVSPFGFFGLTSLALPTVELPVSSLTWDVSVPANNRYSRLYGDIEPQNWVGAAEWYAASGAAASSVDDEGDVGGTVETGALPVRISLPSAGTTLRHTRYWIGGDQPVDVRFGHLRGWLRAPAAFLGLVAMTLGLVRVSADRGWLDRLGAFRAAATTWWSAPTTDDGPAPPGSWRARGLFGRAALVLASAFVGFVLFLSALRVLVVLMNPLAG